MRWYHLTYTLYLYNGLERRTVIQVPGNEKDIVPPYLKIIEE